jgi:hypothetical protein
MLYIKIYMTNNYVFLIITSCRFCNIEFYDISLKFFI